MSQNEQMEKSLFKESCEFSLKCLFFQSYKLTHGIRTAVPDAFDPSVLISSSIYDAPLIHAPHVKAVHIKKSLPTQLARISDDFSLISQAIFLGYHHNESYISDCPQSIKHVLAAVKNYEYSLKVLTTSLSAGDEHTLAIRYKDGSAGSGAYILHPDTTWFTVSSSIYEEGLEYVLCPDLTPEEAFQLECCNKVDPNRMRLATATAGDIVLAKGNNEGQPELQIPDNECLYHRSYQDCSQRLSFILSQR